MCVYISDMASTAHHTTTEANAMTTYQQLITTAAQHLNIVRTSMDNGRWTPAKTIAYETALLDIMLHVNNNGGKASRSKIEDEIELAAATA